MRTFKQRLASRKNGKLSHGPVTAQGKAISCMNAVKYGALARDVVLPSIGESAAEYAKFKRNMRASFAPRDAMEKMIVSQIIDDRWRWARLQGAQGQMCEAALERDPSVGLEILMSKAFDGLRRYETMLDRRIFRNLHTLILRERTQEGIK